MRRSHPKALAFGLDAGGIAAFALLLVVLGAREPDTAGRPAGGFFEDPLAAGLALAAVAALVAGGVVALIALVRAPLRTRTGRWGTALAGLCAAFLPVAGVVEAALDLPTGWVEPIVPAWLVTGLVAIVLGALAREPGRRGLLLIPALLGVLTLTFVLGDVVIPG